LKKLALENLAMILKSRKPIKFPMKQTLDTQKMIFMLITIRVGYFVASKIALIEINIDQISNGILISHFSLSFFPVSFLAFLYLYLRH